MERTETCLHSSIHLTIHIYFPKACQISLNNYIVQEQNPVQLGIHFRQIEPKMVQYWQILGVLEFHIIGILGCILKLIIIVELLHLCRFKLLKYWDIRGVREVISFNSLHFNVSPTVTFHLEHNLHSPKIHLISHNMKCVLWWIFQVLTAEFATTEAASTLSEKIA